MLNTRVDGAQFLDLFAGTGAVGIEAISRGAAGCVLVEEAPAAVKVMRTNLAKLGIAARVQVEAATVEKALSRMLNTSRKVGVARAGFDLVFLDPPYEASAEYDATLAVLGKHADLLLREDAIVIAEHSKKSALSEKYGSLARYRVLQQGDAALSFFHATRDV